MKTVCPITRSLRWQRKSKPELRERVQREKLENCLFFDPMPQRQLTDVL
jgi:hypothetical protein